MARLTDKQFLETHAWLTELWARPIDSFSLISARDQHYLHDYFLPSVSISHDDLLRYRKKISADQPSLPQCAGRALKKLQVAIEAGQSNAGLQVQAVARPSVDADAMGRVLAKLARDLDKQDRDAA